MTPPRRAEQPPAVHNLPPHQEPKGSWACRAVDGRQHCQLLRDPAPPAVGDLALVRVGDIGNHTRLATAGGQKLRLYPGDVLAGVFGHRYATDAFEAEVLTTDDLHLLT